MKIQKLQIFIFVFFDWNWFTVVVALNYFAAKVTKFIYLRFMFCAFCKAGKVQFLCE